MSYSSFEDSPFLKALKKRSDLQVFNENKVAGFALELNFDFDDAVNTISAAVTGGADDAKTDLLYVDREEGVVVLIQAYEAITFKQSAKGNKGADLVYALSVLLTSEDEDIPEGIKPHVLDARDAIRSGEINTLHIWYVHNLPENKQIKEQMTPIVGSARSLLQPYIDKDLVSHIDVVVKEVGLETLDGWYRASKQAISIVDIIDVSDSSLGFNIKDSDWETHLTTVSGDWLAKLYRDYDKNQLFSANVRRFMGANKKDNDKVINAGIQNSAQDEPVDFFVYNNGITALVHDLIFDEHNPQKLKSVKGISIVNGAQTTGSLGTLPSSQDLTGIKVGVRFIKCENKDKIERITRFNNSQNKVIQSDFRANDSVQRRLRNEFETLSSAEYDGGLRGTPTRDRKKKIDAHAAAQALMAWHGSPSDSYHKKMAIWDDDDLYGIAFNNSISAKHVLFVFSLLEATSILKDDLRLKEKNGSASDIEKEVLAILNERGSSFLIIKAIRKVLEIILDSKIKSPYGICFKESMSRDKCIDTWKELIWKLSHVIRTLRSGLRNRLSNQSEIETVTDSFSSSFGTIYLSMKGISPTNPYKEFVKCVENKAG